MNNNDATQVPSTPAPAHIFAGIDGRCMACDRRPHTSEPCDPMW